MKQKNDHSDEHLLETLKTRFDKKSRDQFYDRRVQNLSVDVLRERDRRRSRRSRVRNISLAVSSLATAVLLLIVQPWQSPAPESANTGAQAISIEEVNTSALAADYLDALIEEESVDLLVESAAADPLMLTENDIDQLFEGL